MWFILKQILRVDMQRTNKGTTHKTDKPEEKTITVIVKRVDRAPSTPADTALPALRFKYWGSQPSFWQLTKAGKRETPLFNNECMGIFLSAEQKTPRYDMKHSITMAARERWINKIFHRCIKQQGYKQVISLGSGFDSRPLKKSAYFQKGKKHADIYAKVKFWEIDDKSLLKAKEKLISQNKLDKNAEYLAADYTKDDFIKMLSDTHFDPRLPTLIIWEGNLTYLEKEKINEVIDKLHDYLNDFLIIFDYLTESVVTKFCDNSCDSSLKLYKSGIADIELFAKNNNLTILNNQSLDEVLDGYNLNKFNDLMHTNYFICSATKRKPVSSGLDSPTDNLQENKPFFP